MAEAVSVEVMSLPRLQINFTLTYNERQKFSEPYVYCQSTISKFHREGTSRLLG